MYYTHDDGRVVRGGPESDAETAYQYYVSGAALGCPTCLFELGALYYEGRCVEQDDYLALQLYQASWDIVTEQREHDNYAEAHFHLGKCYHRGVGIGVNLNVAQGLLLSAVQESRRRVRDGDQGFQHVLDMALEEWAAVLRALDRQEAEQDKWRGGGQTDRQE